MAFGVICTILSVVCIFAGVHAHKDNDKRSKGFFIMGATFLSGAIGFPLLFRCAARLYEKNQARWMDPSLTEKAQSQATVPTLQPQ